MADTQNLEKQVQELQQKLEKAQGKLQDAQAEEENLGQFQNEVLDFIKQKATELGIHRSFAVKFTEDGTPQWEDYVKKLRSGGRSQSGGNSSSTRATDSSYGVVCYWDGTKEIKAKDVLSQLEIPCYEVNEKGDSSHREIVALKRHPELAEVPVKLGDGTWHTLGEVVNHN